MIIDFNRMEEVATPQFKGGTGDAVFRTYNDGTNKIMLGRLDTGCSIGNHLHETNSEIIYVLSGEARCLYDGAEEQLNAGMCHYCPQGHEHSLINASESTPLIFLAIVSNC
ncbi:MAG: cupin domain-containing protein [Bacteroidaceae bacterium]|nr:cupin domain-containing protein [Bacteroidaceae bacterium]